MHRPNNVESVSNSGKVHWEHNTNGPFTMFNTGGVEIEVGEFLYALVRLIKPLHILETGTHFGISAAYMAMAAYDNGWAEERDNRSLTTCEVDPNCANAARLKWESLGIDEEITLHLGSSLEFQWDRQELIDLLLLDSEPHLRFSEFTRFWPHVKPGGFILLHDLHPNLSYATVPVNGMACWPFGDFRESLGPHIRNHDVQVVSFPTPRGFTMLQKARDDFAFTQHLKGVI